MTKSQLAISQNYHIHVFKFSTLSSFFYFPKRPQLVLLLISTLTFSCCHTQVNDTIDTLRSNPTIDDLYSMTLEELMNVKVNIGSRDHETPLFLSPTPISIITEEDIRKTGLTDLGLILQRLLPFVNAPRPSLNDGTDHSPPVFMRGMNPDQILVLINGKRRHITSIVHTNIVGRGSTSIDFNSIPPESIERIEIMRDGASAQYGSDAIAGIINIILKKESKSCFVSQYGQTIENDGASSQISANFSDKIGEKGYANFTTSYRQKNFTNRSGIDEREQYFSNQTTENQNFLENPKQTFRYGETAMDNYSFITNLEIPLTEKSAIYTFGTFNYRESESAAFFRRPSDNGNIRSIYPDGFLPLIKPVIIDGSALAGYKTEINQWKIDLSGQYGINSFRFNLNNSVNASMGLNSPTSFYCGTLISSHAIVNMDLIKKFDIGLLNPLSFAWGGEMRIENFQIKSGDIYSYRDGEVAVLDGPNEGLKAPAGAQGFPGFRPEDEANKNRTNKSLYVDFRQTLGKNFLASIAGRYESYSDFGSKLNGKACFSYEPLTNFVIRTSGSTGFRAPSLAQSYYSYTQSSFIATVPYALGIFPVNHPVSIALGAQALKPETSVNLNIGVNSKLKKKMFFSVDYFIIQIKDRIALTPNLTKAVLPEFSTTFDTLKIQGSRYFFNGLNTFTHGIDINFTYDCDLKRFGDLKITASATTNETKILGEVKLPGVLAQYSSKLFDRDYINRLTKVQPGTNIMLQFNYIINRIDLLFRANRYGEYVFINISSSPEYDQVFRGKVVADAEFTYHLTSSIKLSVGGNNIFNSYPDESFQLPGDFLSGKVRKYNWFSPYGFQGASYYGKLVLIL